ncbi:MAG: LptF/LptG family permease [Bacteroidetes bacterium]|nr:LptF/LptG family permease [Bacteroidota bacterium]MBK9048178.1 LptF/LptG family permease [Bacteroidota bacterium]MBK9425287.1 LptF/LptG family permease [Bacteroidota bacterium]
MKKLYKLVFVSFLAPFAATFFVVLFVLLMQFLWKYIDDLVGKGLEWYVIGELLFYASATLVPLALPLAILVSSIMTLGNLAEHYELVAAKSAGIPLQKILRPLLGAALAISIMAFYFSNYMLPYTNLKMGSLLYDVRQQKPALYIREGIFYNGIDGYSIKIGKKESDNQTLHNVMIYDHTAQKGNTKVVIAEKGKMAMSDDEKYLIVTLLNGHSYEEQKQGRPNERNKNPLLRNQFKTYKISFDLSTFKLNRTNEDLFKDNYQMLNLDQLETALDSFEVQLAGRKSEMQKTVASYYMTFRDSLLKTPASNETNFNRLDTLISDPVYESALGQARNVKAYLTSTADEMDAREKLQARFAIEWHRKYTLSIACFILFLIGAPLGAIIRKGGIGMPVVVSVMFFLVFHVMSIMGEKFAREGVIEPRIGMWIAPAVLLPVGLFLLYKATRDSALFDIELYSRFFKKLIPSRKK